MDDHTYTSHAVVSKRKRSQASVDRDRRRQKTRVNIGSTFDRWNEFKDRHKLQSHAEVACFLLDSYKRCHCTPSKSCDGKGRPNPPVSRITKDSDRGQDVLANQHELSVQRLPEERERSCLEESESVPSHDKFIMVSIKEEDQDISVSPSIQSPAQDLETKAATSQSLTSSEEQTTKWSENNKNRVQDDEDEELMTSLSVSDGRHQVDLGSSSGIIVDEECVLELFKSCRKCNQKCRVIKHVNGLKISVNQECCFCQSRVQWTNLSDDDDNGDSQINERSLVTSQNDITGS